MQADDEPIIGINPNLDLRNHFDFTDRVIKYALAPETITEDGAMLDSKHKVLIIRSLLERVSPEYKHEKRKLKPKFAKIAEYKHDDNYKRIACRCFREFKIGLDVVKKEITKQQTKCLIQELSRLLLLEDEYAKVGFQVVKDYGGMTPELEATELRSSLDKICKDAIAGKRIFSPEVYVQAVEYLFLVDSFKNAKALLAKSPESLPLELSQTIDSFRSYLQPTIESTTPFVSETRKALFESKSKAARDVKMDDQNREKSANVGFVKSDFVGTQIGKRKRELTHCYNIWRAQRLCKKRRLNEWPDIDIENKFVARRSAFLSLMKKLQDQDTASAKKQLCTLQMDAFSNITQTELVLVFKEFFDCGEEGWPVVSYFYEQLNERCTEKDTIQKEMLDFVSKLAKVLIQSQDLNHDSGKNLENQSAATRYKRTQCVSNFCSVIQYLCGERKREYFSFLGHCTAANSLSSLLSGCITLLQARSDGNSLKDKKRSVLTSREECYSEQDLDEHVTKLPQYREVMARLLQIQLDCGQEDLTAHNLKFDHVLGMLADLYILQKKYQKAVMVLLIEAKRAGSLTILINKNPLVRKLVRCFRRLEHWTTALVCCQFMHDKSPNGIPRERWIQGSEIVMQMRHLDLSWLPYLANADLLSMITEVILASDKRVQKDRLQKHLKSGVLSFQPKDLGRKFLDNLYHVFVVNPK